MNRFKFAAVLATVMLIAITAADLVSDLTIDGTETGKGWDQTRGIFFVTWFVVMLVVLAFGDDE